MPAKKINHSDPTSLLIITTSGEEVMWQPLLISGAACFQNNCQSCERILMTFSGNVENGTRKTKLYFCWGFGFRRDFDHPKIKGQEALIIKQPTTLCNRVLLPICSSCDTTAVTVTIYGGISCSAVVCFLPVLFYFFAGKVVVEAAWFPCMHHMWIFFAPIVIISKCDTLDSEPVPQISVRCSYLHPEPYFQSLRATVRPSPQEFFMSHHLSCHIRFLPQAFLEERENAPLGQIILF